MFLAYSIKCSVFMTITIPFLAFHCRDYQAGQHNSGPLSRDPYSFLKKSAKMMVKP